MSSSLAQKIPLLFNSASSASNGMLSGLKFYYELDEASGTRSDSVGSNHLTDHNTVGSDTGISSALAAATVAANSEYLRKTNETALQNGGGDFTIAFWYYPIAFGGGGYGYVASKFIGGFEWLFAHTASYLRFSVSNDGTTQNQLNHTTFGSLTANNWYHVVAYHDTTAEQIGMYINGSAQSKAHTGDVNESTAPLELFRYGDDPQYMTARLQGFGMWSRVLSPANRTFLYNGGAGRTYAEFN